ncbi:MAG TPA: hypothetical protein VF129_00760 [Actinomycetota bacterium]
MRRVFMVLLVVGVGVLASGFASAIAATGIAQEETIVFGEHTLKGRCSTWRANRTISCPATGTSSGAG